MLAVLTTYPCMTVSWYNKTVNQLRLLRTHGEVSSSLGLNRRTDVGVAMSEGAEHWNPQLRTVHALHQQPTRCRLCCQGTLLLPLW